MILVPKKSQLVEKMLQLQYANCHSIGMGLFQTEALCFLDGNS